MNKITIPFFLLIIASLVLAGCSGAASAKTLPAMDSQSEASNPGTISVSGQGKTVIAPDIAFINIGVHTENEDAAKAVAENNQNTQDVSDALVAAGVDEDDIQTTNFSIYPRQGYDQQGQPTGEVTYIVDNSVQIIVRDLDTIGDLLNATVQAGANQINGIQFDVSDKTKALSEARSAAVENAEVVATELAEAAGVSLGDVQSIQTYRSDFPSPYDKGMGGGAIAMAESAIPVPVSPGQMWVTVEVNVVYEIQ